MRHDRAAFSMFSFANASRGVRGLGLAVLAAAGGALTATPAMVWNTTFLPGQSV